LDLSCGNWAELDLTHGGRGRSVQSNQDTPSMAAMPIERRLGKTHLTGGRVWSKGLCNDQRDEHQDQPSVEP
jgi:hypothetical protein